LIGMRPGDGAPTKCGRSGCGYGSCGCARLPRSARSAGRLGWDV
jgi:hypothetical protein